jgi:hypothetical protein
MENPCGAVEAFEVAASSRVRSFPADDFDPGTLVPGVSRSARRITRRRVWRWFLYQGRLLKPVPIPVALMSRRAEPGFTKDSSRLTNRQSGAGHVWHAQ